MSNPVRRGRRPGPSTTRGEILEAARTLFGRHGYDGTSLRMIAEAAGVDAALVTRAFDGKHGLFVAAVRWPWDPADVLPTIVPGPKRTAGHRLARLSVDTWEDPARRAPILALLASTSESEPARRLLRDFVSTQILVPFARGCGFDRPELRGALLAAHQLGLVLTRYVLGVEPLAGLDAATLVEVAGSGAQRILSGPLPAATEAAIARTPPSKSG
jgi:AcrR family transcriptional regulator